MLKKHLLLVLFLFTVFVVSAQIQADQTFSSIDAHFAELNKKGMLVLGSWGAANLLAGTALSLNMQGKSKYFWQMTAAWNTINLGISAAGYFGGSDAANAGELLSTLHGYQKAYLFNAGLDAAYIMTGFLLREIARNKVLHADRLTGYGNAIILQGAFLMAFDWVMYAIHHQEYQLIVSPWIDSFTSSAGLSFSIQF